MSDLWTVCGVQMNSTLGDKPANLRAIITGMERAAEQGAKLVVFPECVLAGYGFNSRAECLAVAETLPGPATDNVAKECARLGIWVVFGLLEKDEERGKLFNACALVGPDGYRASYRKLHLPCLGADRFTDPGDRPFEVQDIGGLKLGMNICFDGSFPESSRILTLLGADLIVLPTNWATNARTMATLVSAARAWENHIYYLAVNRIGEESGFTYIGKSSCADYTGAIVQWAPENEPAIIKMNVDPIAARQKRVVTCAGEYEIDRVNWRRPELYGPLVEGTPFTGHMNK